MKKRIALLMALVLTLLPVAGLADNGTPILGPATTSVEAMEAWARKCGAHPEFINQAQNFYDISVAYGVDPAVTYAQSAKETNFFKFTGVLTIDFKNPCGLKTTKGGDNYDPEAHQRFTSWEEGITAQVHHLALYAGHEDFPKADSPDPRHFDFCYGTARTVEDLGGKWAPSPTYGEEIVKSMASFADLKEEGPAPLTDQGLSQAEPARQVEEDQRRILELQTGEIEVYKDALVDPIERLAGANRNETSIEISKKIASHSADRLILASDQNFPDALLASSLTRADGGYAPILLTGKNVNQSIINEIDRLNPDTVVIVGSYQLISKDYGNLLRANGYNVERIEAANRYAVANEIARRVGSKDYILVNGNVFADALTTSALAARESRPILFTDGTSLDPETEARLKEANSVLIVGGDNSVSQELETKISQSSQVKRISGSNRYDTAIRIAEEYFPGSQAMVLANGQDYPDALAGGPLAAKYGAPILLSPAEDLPASLQAYLGSANMKNALVLGGTSSIHQKTADQVAGYIK